MYRAMKLIIIYIRNHHILTNIYKILKKETSNLKEYQLQNYEPNKKYNCKSFKH